MATKKAAKKPDKTEGDGVPTSATEKLLKFLQKEKIVILVDKAIDTRTEINGILYVQQEFSRIRATYLDDLQEATKNDDGVRIAK